MTKKPLTKRIPTYSWLLRRTEQLFRTNREAFQNLMVNGTDQLISGVKVHMNNPSLNAPAVFKLQSNSMTYCDIRGFMANGELHTNYDTNFSTTQWKPKLDAFLPYTVQDKLSYENGGRVTFHNADGSEAGKGKWQARRRGRSGEFYFDCYETPLVIQDSTGKLLLTEGGTQDKYRNWNRGDPVDVWAEFFPGSCHSKSDWYESMVPPKDRPDLWDEVAVRLLAAKVHAAAIKLCSNIPHLKIALFPMAKSYGLTTCRRFLNSGLRDVVLDRSGPVPEAWNMPEIVVYWTEREPSLASYYPEQVRFVRVQIPPIGNRLLQRDAANSSVVSGTNRTDRGDSRPVEMAYHGLPCLLPEHASSTKVRYCLSTGFIRAGCETDRKFVDWSTTRDRVMVCDRSTHDLLRTSDDRQFIACKPEDAFNSIEERQLIESLPLC